MPFILYWYEVSFLKFYSLTVVTVWINVQFYKFETVDMYCNVWGNLILYEKLEAICHVW